MLNSVLVILVCFLMLSGCAAIKDWSATLGSKADGVVRLSYEVSEMKQPVLNAQQTAGLATQRCKKLGYTGAEARGGVTTQCSSMTFFSGCSQWVLTREYQCTGAPHSTKAYSI